ncbi:MAG: DUF3102 domain-containing protein [Bacillota bacterium]|nr:DUF3102 domain-containing protein [Bacillota bacterium]
MNEISVVRTPELIALEINNIKDQTRALVLFNSIEIGRRLTEAKELVEHGEWGNWLEERVNYSKSTANNLMKIFNEYGADQLTLLSDKNIKSEVFEKLNYSQAVELLGVPSEEREKFIEENNVEDMSTRELKEKIKEIKKLNKALEEANKSKENMEQQIKQTNEDKENLSQVITDLQNQITAHNEKQNPVIEELTQEIFYANQRIKELENNPIEVNTDITEEEKAEKEALRKQVEILEKQLEEQKKTAKPSQSLAKMSVCVRDISGKFSDILNIIEAEEDYQLRDKLKIAASKLLKMMEENLNSQGLDDA